MNQPLLVSITQSTRCLSDDRRGRPHVQMAVYPDVLAKVASRDVFRYEKRHLAIVPSVKSLYQIFVMQAGLGADFVHETGGGFWSSLVPRQHFHCHDATHDHVLGLEDLSHTAPADRLKDFIIR